VLKFFPNIKEAVAFGDGRDFAPPSSTSTCRRSATGPSATTSPTPPTRSWPAIPEVYKIIARPCRRDQPAAGAEPMMAGAQIKRFLVLHKELDADDGELTRTMKVRRGFVADRYAPLIEALYDGSTENMSRRK
jgi:long-chain acyl-CoA synthetase